MSKKFKIGVVIEAVVLFVALIVLRGVVFPAICESMLHIKLATHALMIGITATIFTIFALCFRKKWKTHGRFILIPVIFTIFGFMMHIISYEVDF